jgi:DNA-binding CsgD family transcriptional regulator
MNRVDALLVWYRGHQAAIWAAVGLGAMGVWMNLVGYSSAFAPLPATSAGFAQPELSRYAFYAGIVCCSLFVIVIGRFITAAKASLDFVIGVVMCMGTAAFGIAYQQQLFDPVVLATAGCWCSGIGYAWFVWSFYLLLVRSESLRVSILSVTASLIIETILAMVLNILLEQSSQVLVGITMPFLACALLVVTQYRIKSPVLVEQKVSGAQERFLILVLVIGTLSLLLIRSVTSVGLWGATRVDLALQPLLMSVETVGSCMLFAVIAWFALVRRSSTSLYSRFQVPILIIMAGCLGYFINAVMNSAEQGGLIAGMATNSIELFGHLFNWTVVITGVKLLRFSSYRILGLAGAAYNSLAIIWIAFFEESPQVIPVLVVFGVYLIMFCVVIATLGIQKAAAKQDAQSIEPIATEYGLTQREREVLGLLAQGRSRPYIQEKLNMADGTIKTHTTHIYSKLGIHTRQELLDLLEGRRDF